MQDYNRFELRPDAAANVEICRDATMYKAGNLKPCKRCHGQWERDSLKIHLLLVYLRSL